MSDLFSAQNALNIDFMKWENVGDKIAGTLVDKKQNTVPNKYGHLTEDYIIITEDGRKVNVQGRSYKKGAATIGKDLKVIFGMEEIPLGAVVGFIFTGTKENSNGNPTKLVEPRYAGESRPDVLAEYQGKFGGVTVTASDAAVDPTQPQF